MQIFYWKDTNIRLSLLNFQESTQEDENNTFEQEEREKRSRISGSGAEVGR